MSAKAWAEVSADRIIFGEGMSVGQLEDYLQTQFEAFFKSKVEAITENPIDNHLETSYENWFNNWMTENGHDYQDIPIDEMLTGFANHLLEQLLKQ